MTRNEKILHGAAMWAGYYRCNPHRFVNDYLHIELKPFQKILIVMMNISRIVVFIGARGIGKTFLSAIFCVVRAILYPESKICIASGVRAQGINVLEKILLELKPRSPELALEIDSKETKINGTNAQIVFKNGSYIKVVTAKDTARGNRANVLLLDEFRLIAKDVLDTVLKKFLTQRRMPRYQELTKQEKEAEYSKEKNMTMYLSSAYWVDHWSYQKCEDAFDAMICKGQRQFVCSLPYQLSISEGLLDADTIADEMQETDFSEVKFSMEYESLFYGAGDGAFFDFPSISKNRHIKYPMLPNELASVLGGNALIRIPQKQNGEIRILSADIALMSSKKNHNDATSVFINQMLPTKSGRYTSNIVFGKTYEGLRTDDQALAIRKLYDEYACDYIVLDANGLGLGVYDALAKELNDPDTGEIYPALSCCNDKAMADRCVSPDADKVIWSIKASATFNSDCAYLLREGFRSGKIRLLVSEYDAPDLLSEIKGYNSMSDAEKYTVQAPYYDTTMLIDELTRLQHEESNGKVRIYEKAGMRKDRYSSLSYNYYVACQLETKMSRQRGANTPNQIFIIKAPAYKGRTVNRGDGRGYSWR